MALQYSFTPLPFSSLSANYVARGDILLYLLTFLAAHPKQAPKPFCVIASTRLFLLSATDEHFGFYCTPCYGYFPPTLHYMYTMIWSLPLFLLCLPSSPMALLS